MRSDETAAAIECISLEGPRQIRSAMGQTDLGDAAHMRRLGCYNAWRLSLWALTHGLSCSDNERTRPGRQFLAYIEAPGTMARENDGARGASQRIRERH